MRKYKTSFANWRNANRGKQQQKLLVKQKRQINIHYLPLILNGALNLFGAL